MSRCPRLAAGGLAYHVLNRRVGRLPLFEKLADYVAFEKILAEAQAHTGLRVAAYCLMPNHWHLLLWPRRDGVHVTPAGAAQRLMKKRLPTPLFSVGVVRAWSHSNHSPNRQRRYGEARERTCIQYENSPA